MVELGHAVPVVQVAAQLGFGREQQAADVAHGLSAVPRHVVREALRVAQPAAAARLRTRQACNRGARHRPAALERLRADRGGARGVTAEGKIEERLRADRGGARDVTAEKKIEERLDGGNVRNMERDCSVPFLP